MSPKNQINKHGFATKDTNLTYPPRFHLLSRQKLNQFFRPRTLVCILEGIFCLPLRKRVPPFSKGLRYCCSALKGLGVLIRVLSNIFFDVILRNSQRKTDSSTLPFPQTSSAVTQNWWLELVQMRKRMGWDEMEEACDMQENHAQPREPCTQPGKAFRQILFRDRLSPGYGTSVIGKVILRQPETVYFTNPAPLSSLYCKRYFRKSTLRFVLWYAPWPMSWAIRLKRHT